MSEIRSATEDDAAIAAGPAAGPRPEEHLGSVGRRTIVLLVVATFGAGIATLVPMAFSLALRLDQLAPGRADLLGYVLGANAVSSLVTTPLTGILSDRTRTRWGRRRPYTVGGLVLGVATTPVMVFAPDVVVLAFGWMLCSLGFGTAAGSIGNFQADRLPAHQRGRVSGLTNVTIQIAPVVGILLAGRVADDTLWVFLLPALIGVVCMSAFVVFVDEADSRGLVLPDRLSIGRVLRSYGFRPREVPDFAWNWAGRFAFFFALSLTTTYTTFFFAHRLERPVAEVVTVLAITSAQSIVSAFFGSIGAGWLSDRLRRRGPLIVAGAALFAIGCVVSAFAWTMSALLAGSFVSSLGIATFVSVNQALVLDVLPHRDTQAGRFMAIATFSQKLPTALAPLVAPLVLEVPGADEPKNYTAVYLTAAVLSLAGGIIISTRVEGVR